jgi:hypothetical protein
MGIKGKKKNPKIHKTLSLSAIFLLVIRSINKMIQTRKRSRSDKRAT